MSKSDPIKKIKAALREERLKQEKNFGRQVSQVFDSKPSVKEERRKSKSELRRIVSTNDYNIGDD